MTGSDIPYEGENPRTRLPAAQVFRRTAPPRQAPWERDGYGRPRGQEFGWQPVREMRSYPAPPSPDGGPAPDNSVTQLIPRFRDEDYPPVAPQPAAEPAEPDEPAPKTQHPPPLTWFAPTRCATLRNPDADLVIQLIVAATSRVDTI